MDRDLTLRGFLKDLGMRAGAAAIVIGIFAGLGYLNQANVLGLSNLLGHQAGFFAAAFLLVGLASVGWVGFQHYKR